MAPWLAKNVSTPATPSIRWATASSAGGTGTRRRTPSGRTPTGPRPIDADALWSSRSSTSPAGPTGNRRSTSRWPPWPCSGAGSRRVGLALLAATSAYLFLTWWLLTHRLDRFWLPLLPALAVLAGLGADWTRGRAWSVLLGLGAGRRDRAEPRRTARPPWRA